MTDATGRRGRILTLLALVAAGEAAFFLPFVVVRVFRPTLLDVFELSNTQLGIAFSVYGVVAMLAYFPSGPIADRFPPRKLMTAALVMTALGGLYMATTPSHAELLVLYGIWGLSTILLFWSALMRATREWGGVGQTGRAFGLLDGGRGLVAALAGALASYLFSTMLPEGSDAASPAERAEALRQVILLFTGLTFGVAAFVWLALPPRVHDASGRETFQWAGVGSVLRNRAVWLQAVIIVCAYSGYKGLDDLPLYAHEVMGMDETRAAELAATALWLRPVSAVTAGFLADRFSASLMTIIAFAMMLAGSLAMGAGWVSSSSMAMFLLAAIPAAVGIFALRGLYFAIMGETRVPLTYTGTAVGFVSMIGYTPDVFMGPTMGVLLDSSPGAQGHSHVFLLVALFALIGLLSALAIRFILRNNR